MKDQREKELLEVGQEYEKILVNFNGVIEHLVQNQKQKPTHDHLWLIHHQLNYG